MPAPLRRRSFIQATGASLGALSLRGFAVDKPAAAHFTHGIASGDPLADRVILWTRVLPGSGNAEQCLHSGRWRPMTASTLSWPAARRLPAPSATTPSTSTLRASRRAHATATDSWPMA